MGSIDDFVQSIRTDYKIPMFYFFNCLLLDKVVTLYAMQNSGWAHASESSPLFRFFNGFSSQGQTVLLVGLAQIAAMTSAAYLAHRKQNKGLVKKVIYIPSALMMYASLVNVLQL